MPIIPVRHLSPSKAAERRAAKSKAWHENPNNANNRIKARWDQIEAARIAADLTAETSGNSGSLNRLRAIMGNPDAPLYRRIEAAEITLGYELAPGALAGADPDAVAAGSYKFLKAVVSYPDIPEQLEMRVLKAIAQVENMRSQIRNAGEQLGMKRQMLVELVNTERRAALVARGAWPCAQRWWLDTADVFAWPPDWPGMWSWPPSAIADSYRRDAASFRETLRAVRATSRDDPWDG
jgi:hypothetical protein